MLSDTIFDSSVEIRERIEKDEKETGPYHKGAKKQFKELLEKMAQVVKYLDLGIED